MKIEMIDWRIPDKIAPLGFKGDNLVKTLEFITDADPEWQFKLDVNYWGKANVIDMARDGNTLSVLLTADMLGFNGVASAQLRGISGEKVRHTNKTRIFVSDAINGIDNFPPMIPSEMAQLEERITDQKIAAEVAAQIAGDAVGKTPYIGENGNWFVWDSIPGLFTDTGLSAQGPEGAAAEPATSDYGYFTQAPQDVATHNVTATAHTNLVIDGNAHSPAVDDTLAEHAANANAHGNLNADGGIF